MKLKIFIVRYKEDLNPILRSLREKDSFSLFEVYVINNYGKIFKEDFEGIFPSNLFILNNEVRPDFSTGHLSRSWNQAIINGFKDLSSPDADVLVLIQADSLFKENFYEIISNFYNSPLIFASSGRGDECMMLKPEIIKRVGLFDERYCNIAYQEGDYFLRCYLKEKERCLILDYLHRRVNIPKEIDSSSFIPIDIIFPSQPSLENSRSMAQSKFSYINFVKKWKGMRAEEWDEQIIKEFELSGDGKEIILYPYFEKDIDMRVYFPALRESEKER